MITQEKLKELFHYDCTNGEFINSKGKVVGSVNGDGYKQITIDYKNYRLHRLVWIYHYKNIPEKMCIDHINGNRLDNTLTNLRLATLSENQQNRKKLIHNKSGYTGVAKVKNKWFAQISYQSKTISLGYFNTVEMAYEAYLKAKSQLHIFNPIPRN